MSDNTARGNSHPNDDELLASAIPIEGLESDDDEPLDLIPEDEAPNAPGASAAKPLPSPSPAETEELEPIAISSDATGPSKEIRAFGDRKRHEDEWDRTPNVTGKGAIHVKTFVSKLRLDAIEHMDQMINEWLDSHPEYEVKFTSSSVGNLTGKLTEPALFVSVWV